MPFLSFLAHLTTLLLSVSNFHTATVIASPSLHPIACPVTHLLHLGCVISKFSITNKLAPLFCQISVLCKLKVLIKNS